MIELHESDIGVRCDQCRRIVIYTVIVGTEEDAAHDRQLAWLCRDCVLLALMAFEEVAA